MNDREKLIELIESARYWGSNTSAEIADYLIASGVVIQENKKTESIHKATWVITGGNKFCWNIYCSNCGTETVSYNLHSFPLICPHCEAEMTEAE